jgi:histidinol-phosphate aminotransferase
MAKVTGVERFISLKFPETGKAARVTVPSAQRGGIRLGANENPYGCSPRIMQVLADYPDLNLYPDLGEMKKLLAEYAGVGEEYVVPSHGASEILDLIALLFVGSGDEVIHCPRSFELFNQRAQLYGGTLVAVPRDENFAVNVAAVKAAITKKTKMIILVNPNNPTGTLTPIKDILEIVDTGVPVLVDEAYAEFSGQTLAPFVSQYENLMVVRTLSKWAGLAGVRVGFGIVPPKVAEYIARITLTFHVNRVATVAVRESMKDLDYLMGNVKLIVAERERLFSELGKLKFLKPIRSWGNFICCSVLSGDAVEIQRGVLERGIRIIAIDIGRGGVNALRITVGKPEHTDTLIKVLREVAAEKGLPL